LRASKRRKLANEEEKDDVVDAEQCRLASQQPRTTVLEGWPIRSVHQEGALDRKDAHQQHPNVLLSAFTTMSKSIVPINGQHSQKVCCVRRFAVVGRYGARTASGTSVDIVKSDFQKAIRQGRVVQALVAFFEMYNMETIFPDHAAAKANRTNIINRMMICAAEDIGPANVPLVQLVITTGLMMQKYRNKRDAAVFAALVEQMALSPKTRICSHLWHAYALPENEVLSRSMGLDIHCIPQRGFDLEKAFRQGDRNVFRLAYEWSLRSNGEKCITTNNSHYHHGHMKPQIDDDNTIMTNHTNSVLASAAVLRPSCRQTNTTTRTASSISQTTTTLSRASPSLSSSQTVGLSLMWKTLQRILPALLVSCLCQAYTTLSEKKPFLQFAVTLGLYANKISEQALSATQIVDRRQFISAHWRQSSALDHLITGQYLYSPDPSAIDKHTLQGRRDLHADRHMFVTEGACVNNQHAEFFDSILHDIYVHSRVQN